MRGNANIRHFMYHCHVKRFLPPRHLLCIQLHHCYQVKSLQAASAEDSTQVVKIGYGELLVMPVLQLGSR